MAADTTPLVLIEYEQEFPERAGLFQAFLVTPGTARIPATPYGHSLDTLKI
jgi:hypothetical protein